MTNYLLSVMIDSTQPQPTPEQMDKMFADVNVFNEKLKAEGSWVWAGGLHPASTATVVRVKDGETIVTDGPYLETKEYLGGFWIVRANDLDAALALAAAGTVACGAPVEVRPFEDDVE
jgi:hypothetical protein